MEILVVAVSRHGGTWDVTASTHAGVREGSGHAGRE